MQAIEPQAQHAWLQKLVGEWTYEVGGEEKMSGKEIIRPLGPFWIVGESEFTMPGGGQGSARITVGFDPQKGRFVGTWVGSMMTYLWVYDGELDASGRVLTLAADGPSMTGDGKTASYEDIIEMVSDDHRLFRARVRGEDGEWQPMMSADYRRVR
ncbi:MAG: DUF1579 domain-containing protein [Pseudolabrys sp.]|nr:DUF1579 domain-containing protein [Pseudolabrys sp.]